MYQQSPFCLIDVSRKEILKMYMVMVVDNIPFNVYNLSMENVEGYIYTKQHYILKDKYINTTKNHGMVSGLLL